MIIRIRNVLYILPLLDRTVLLKVTKNWVTVMHLGKALGSQPMPWRSALPCVDLLAQKHSIVKQFI